MGVKFCEQSGAWLDGYVLEWLDNGKEAVKDNWDFIALIDGVEGSGKSSLALTCAYYLDRTFSHERIVFTPEQAIAAIDEATPGQAIVWDEFVLGGLSDDAMKAIQTTIIKKLVTIRKKRLYIFLVIPYIFMLRTYFAVGRTRLLMHTYTPDGIKRGHVKIYNYERKKDLYFKGKKFYDYIVPPNRRAEFGNAAKWGFLDWGAYEAKKDEATKDIQVENISKKDNKFREALKQIISNGLISVNDTYLQELTGINARMFRTLRAEAVARDNINNPDSTGLS